MPANEHIRIGRNDPCYCGSGKKYKRCHGLVTAASLDTVYDRIRRYDGESAALILRFARNRFGEQVMLRAWEEFHFSDGTHFDIEGPEGDPFTRWFTFNWKPEGKKTLAELFLSGEGKSIDPDLLRFIETTVRSPYSFYQTVDVQPGEHLTLRDVLRKREVQVTERAASSILQRGHIVLARVVEMDGCSFFMGTGEKVIPPIYMDHVLALREYLERQSAGGDASLSTAALLEREEDLREAYVEIGDEMSQPLEVRNTDGDPLAFHTLTYQIPSRETAFNALQDLQQKVTQQSDEELLQEAKATRPGKPSVLTLHWLRKGYKGGFEDSTALATLTFGKSRLVVEVNSDRRSKRIQKEIRKR